MTDETNTLHPAPVERVVRLIAVLAGTRNEFVEYKRRHSDKRLVFCDRWPEFAGVEFSEIVEIGTFRLRPDALQIYQQVLPMVRTNDPGKQPATTNATRDENNG